MGRQSCPAKEKGPTHPSLPTGPPCPLPCPPPLSPGYGRTRCVGREVWARMALSFCPWRPNKRLTQKSPLTLQKPWSPPESPAFLLGVRSHLKLSLPSAKKARGHWRGLARPPAQVGKQAERLPKELRAIAACITSSETRIVIPCRFPFDWVADNSQHVRPS